jgi:hypothetical protein
MQNKTFWVTLSYYVSSFILLFPIWKLQATETPIIIQNHVVYYFRLVRGIACLRWSQQPRGLRHELYSLSQTLGSWVWIPLKAWKFGVRMRLFCVCVVLCVGSGLATGWSTVQRVLPTVYRIKKLKSGQGPTKGCTAVDREIHSQPYRS